MKIQVSIAGYTGKATTLIGKFDESTGILAMAKQVEFKESRLDGFAMVSDLDLPDLDYRFTDKQLREAIHAYFTRNAREMIAISEALIRFKPDNKIEADTVDESGRKYRIAADIDNGQVAILAACAFLEAQNPINAAIAMLDELADFYVTTI